MAPFYNTNAHTTEYDHNGMAEDCYELGPHSPSTSLSSWGPEKGRSVPESRKLPPHKSSQCRLLAWVAIDRNSHQGISLAQRCTCPMVGCGSQFPSPEYMHMHLKTSECLFKSTYHCLETGKEVRIGKCDSRGCQELKGRFVSAVSSSVESVKRHLSGRRSKHLQASQLCVGRELNPEETDLLEAPWGKVVPRTELALGDLKPSAEMGPAFKGMTPSRHEMDAYFVPFELCSTPAPHHKPTDRSQEEHFPSLYSSDSPAATSLYQDNFRYPTPQAASTMGDIHPMPHDYHMRPSQLDVQSENGNTSTTLFSETTYNHTGPVELCAGGTSWGRCQTRQMNSTWSLSSPFNINTLGELRTGSHGSDLPGLSSSTHHSQDVYPHEQATTPIYNDYEYMEKMVVDDFRTTPKLDSLPELTYPNLQTAPRTDSRTGSDSSFAPSMFSSVSSTSTSQSSFGSYNSTPTNFNDTSFFGEDSIMFEEPEPMWPSPTAMSYEQGCNHFSPNTRRFETAGVSIDNYVKPGCYLSDRNLNGYHTPAQQQFTRDPTKLNTLFEPRQPPSPPKVTNPNASSPPTPPSTLLSPPTSTCPSPQPLLPGKAYCRHCQTPCDMSNRSRHEKTCKQNPAYACTPRIACHYPGCRSTFSRKDNLTQHQRLQNHFVIGNVELKFSLTPTPGSPVWNLAMQALEQEGGNGMTQMKGDGLWMNVDNVKI